MRIAPSIFILVLALCQGADAAAPNSALPTASPAPHGTAPVPPVQTGRLANVAPADAYFGPFGMSPLSIRSTIGLLGRQYHYRTISDHDLLRKALITEDALRKWRSKYPGDPWLAPTFFHLEQLYQAVQTDEARKHATAILKDVARNYPDTRQGHLSRARLAAGFPPLVAETPLVSPPPAAGPASEAASSTETSASSTETSVGPSAPPSPDPTPSPK